MTAMHDLILFMFPGACSRVTMSALEEVGLDYEERMVNLRSGEQKSSAYLSLNPKGKVPALRMGERIITENSAIIWSLHLEHPNANLLPRDHDPVAYDQGLIDLIWCSGTMHPIVRQIRNPMRLTKGDTSGVRADGLEKFAHECEALGDRLSGGDGGTDPRARSSTFTSAGYAAQPRRAVSPYRITRRSWTIQPAYAFGQVYSVPCNARRPSSPVTRLTCPMISLFEVGRSQSWRQCILNSKATSR